MKIRFVTNACMEILTKSVRLLCDPWLVPGAFDGSWWQNPPLRFTPEDFRDYTHLYISHIHQDHCDPRTLRRLPNKQIPVILLKSPDGFLKKRIASCGFTNFIEVTDGETITLQDGIDVTIYAAFTQNPFIDVEVPNIIDSSLVVTDGEQTFLNINDNTPVKVACQKLKDRHGRFHAATVPYSGVGPFPSSYQNLSEEEKKKQAAQKALKYTNRLLEIAETLQADMLFPAAGQMILGGRQMKKNETLGIATQEESTVLLQQAGFPAACLEEGDVFDLTTRQKEKTLPSSRWSEDALSALAQERYWWEDAFQIPIDQQIEILPLLQIARERLARYQKKYEFWSDWLMGICLEENRDHVYVFSFENEKAVQKMAKKNFLDSGQKILLVTVPYNYLVAILTRHCHWNNAYHGCHVDWFREPDVYIPELQTLFSFFHL